MSDEQMSEFPALVKCSGGKVGCLEAEDGESISAKTNLSGGSVGEKMGCLEAEDCERISVRNNLSGGSVGRRWAVLRRKTVRVQCEDQFEG